MDNRCLAWCLPAYFQFGSAGRPFPIHCSGNIDVEADHAAGYPDCRPGDDFVYHKHDREYIVPGGSARKVCEYTVS